MEKPGYHITKDKSRLKVRFAFVSKGVKDIVKVVDYDYVGFLIVQKHSIWDSGIMILLRVELMIMQILKMEMFMMF